MKHLLHQYYNGSYTSSWRHQLCFLICSHTIQSIGMRSLDLNWFLKLGWMERQSTPVDFLQGKENKAAKKKKSFYKDRLVCSLQVSLWSQVVWSSSLKKPWWFPFKDFINSLLQGGWSTTISARAWIAPDIVGDVDLYFDVTRNSSRC